MLAFFRLAVPPLQNEAGYWPVKDSPSLKISNHTLKNCSYF